MAASPKQPPREAPKPPPAKPKEEEEKPSPSPDQLSQGPSKDLPYLPEAQATADDSQTAQNRVMEGMTLVQLCDLKAKGFFSDAEFVALKAQLLASL